MHPLCAGTIRHCGLPGHIGKWLALHPSIKDSAEDISFRCGSKWGKKRSEGETRTKVARSAKAQKLARQEMGRHITATFAAAMGGPLTPGNAAAAGSAIAAEVVDPAVAVAMAGSPAAAAAIHTALAGGNGQ